MQEAAIYKYSPYPWFPISDAGAATHPPQIPGSTSILISCSLQAICMWMKNNGNGDDWNGREGINTVERNVLTQW